MCHNLSTDAGLGKKSDIRDKLTPRRNNDGGSSGCGIRERGIRIPLSRTYVCDLQNEGQDALENDNDDHDYHDGCQGN